MVVAFSFFTGVKSFTSSYALVLLFFLRFSSISLHCSPTQFSSAFFMHLLMSLFTSLYFSDPSGSNLFFLNFLLLSRRSRISAVTQGLFFWRCLPRISLVVSVTAVLCGNHRIHFCVFIIHDGERSKLLAYHSLESIQHIWIFQPFRSNLSLVCFGSLILFWRRWKAIIS